MEAGLIKTPGHPLNWSTVSGVVLGKAGIRAICVSTLRMKALKGDTIGVRTTTSTDGNSSISWALQSASSV